MEVDDDHGGVLLFRERRSSMVVVIRTPVSSRRGQGPLVAAEKIEERIRDVCEVEEMKKGGVSCFRVAHLAGKRRKPAAELWSSGE